MRPDDELSALLRQAYLPCSNFGVCQEARWAPQSGHIPRGFLGATGPLEDVELVMVFAEPGHPHPSEVYDPQDSPDTLLENGIEEFKPKGVPVIIGEVVRDIDSIVKAVSFSGWSETQRGDKLVRLEVRKVLKKYELHCEPELFDNAYNYIAANY